MRVNQVVDQSVVNAGTCGTVRLTMAGLTPFALGNVLNRAAKLQNRVAGIAYGLAGTDDPARARVRPNHLQLNLVRYSPSEDLEHRSTEPVPAFGGVETRVVP